MPKALSMDAAKHVVQKLYSDLCALMDAAKKGHEYRDRTCELLRTCCTLFDQIDARVPISPEMERLRPIQICGECEDSIEYGGGFYFPIDRHGNIIRYDLREGYSYYLDSSGARIRYQA